MRRFTWNPFAVACGVSFALAFLLAFPWRPSLNRIGKRPSVLKAKTWVDRRRPFYPTSSGSMPVTQSPGLLPVAILIR